MLILVEVSLLAPVLSVAVVGVLLLVFVLLLLAFVLHLLHGVVKSEVAASVLTSGSVFISPACGNDAVDYIIARHLLVVLWAHLVVPHTVLATRMRVEVVLVVLLLAILVHRALLSSGIVRGGIFQAAVVWPIHKCGH